MHRRRGSGPGRLRLSCVRYIASPVWGRSPGCPSGGSISTGCVRTERVSLVVRRPPCVCFARPRGHLSPWPSGSRQLRNPGVPAIGRAEVQATARPGWLRQALPGVASTATLAAPSGSVLTVIANLEAARPGRRTDALHQAAMTLGGCIAAGALEQAEVEDALYVAVPSNGSCMTMASARPGQPSGAG